MTETTAAIRNSPDRPRLNIERGPVDVIVEALSLLALAATVGLVAFHWSALPDRIPHHFDLAGRPDAWGGKWILLLLPAMSLILYTALTGVGRYPHRFNYVWPITPQNAAGQYRIAISMLAMLKVLIAILFAYVTWMTIRTATGESAGIGRMFLPLFLGAIFVTVFAHLVAAHRAR
jgi:uncharacterized membrane protein